MKRKLVAIVAALALMTQGCAIAPQAPRALDDAGPPRIERQADPSSRIESKWEHIAGMSLVAFIIVGMIYGVAISGKDGSAYVGTGGGGSDNHNPPPADPMCQNALYRARNVLRCIGP